MIRIRRVKSIEEGRCSGCNGKPRFVFEVSVGAANVMQAFRLCERCRRELVDALHAWGTRVVDCELTKPTIRARSPSANPWTTLHRARRAAAAKMSANYRSVCEAKTKRAMLAQFDALLTEAVEKFGGTKEGHRATQLSNVGYFSGYYGRETFDRIHKWLGASHPIFGASYPSSTEALGAGLKAGLEIRTRK